MQTYASMEKTALLHELAKLEGYYENYKAQGLSLNMARGKPGSAQLDISNDMFNSLTPDTDFKTADCPDCRNYGGLEGIVEARQLFADMLGVEVKNVMVGGNSSLNMMFDTIACMMEQAWGNQGKLKFLCPAPGYDRHFGITQYFNIEMI